MSLDDDIARIKLQEEKLRFDRFDEETAFQLGSLIRSMALDDRTPVAIRIELGGRLMFASAMAGTSPDNDEWIKRKIRTTLRFFKSSYGVGRDLEKRGLAFGPERGVDPMDHASAGGSFPIHVRGAGVVGAVAVSGLPQRADHALVVRALCRFLKLPENELSMPPE
jgi:uncharacterized protein (UPF0303 family)